MTLRSMAKARDPMDEIVRSNLKKFREEAKLTQLDAAELSGVPSDNLRRYESGATANVPGTILAKLAKVYGHDTGDFFLDAPPPAEIESAPTWFLRTRPGVEYDADTHRRLQEMVDKANRETRTRRRK